MNKFYDLLKYIIYASFYIIVIKTGMDFYGYKRLHFTELSGRHSVLERPLSEVNGRLFFS